MRHFTIFLAMLATLLQVNAATPSIVTLGEMQSKGQWVKAHLLEPELTDVKFKSSKVPVTPEPGLDVYANNDPVLPNSRDNRPLKIAEKTYSRGLYCHAVSKIVVTLPGPAKRFTAEVGLDHNEDTLRGRGSVVFSVIVSDQIAFKSDIMTVNTPPIPVDVDLKDVTSFIMEIGDAGDGIGWDQSNWADAKVVLENGTQLWLGDMEIRDKRYAGQLLPINRSSTLPFAFLYDGAASDTILRTWSSRMETTRLDANRTRYTRTWKQPNGNLEIRCVAVDYADFPAVEWTLYFKNVGSTDTPILSNIQALDTSLERRTEGEFILHAWRGDTSSPVLYQPLTETLPAKTSRRFAPSDGRGTNHAFPYYKVEMPGGGILLAVGWPGQWASSFATDNQRNLRIIAGQGLTHLSLKPGEQVRTPLIAVLFWKGNDTVRAQNLWRRWMWAHNVPRTRDGKLPPAILFGNTSAEFNEMINANEDNQKYFIDLYRQDFNMSPLSFWRGNDTPDRQGITENFHVQGYLAYWDELRRRNPQLIIDSCASGGRRNDLETMRRAVPLHPTDYNYADLVVKQAFHHSLSQWIPYYGSNTVPIDTVAPYAIRSGHALGMVLGYDMRRTDLDYALLRKLANQWRNIIQCYYGDFYPVLPYSLSDDNWIAWQFHRPDRNEGVVQAFRRPKSTETTKTLFLRGLDPASQYHLNNFDKDKPATISGREILEKGLPVDIPAKPGAVVIHYKTAKFK